MVAEAHWLPMESNPDVITNFLAKIGVQDTKCVDVLGFDEEVTTGPCHAILLCIPNYKKMDEVMGPMYDKLVAEGAKVPEGLFFVKQKEMGKCGAFALVHALVNNRDAIQLGTGSLRRWLEKAEPLGPEERAELLASDETLAEEYAACARGVERGDQTENVPGPQYHFICYVNHNGLLYELDSRMGCPRACGETTQKTFTKDAGAVCRNLMCHSEDITFSALAIVPA